MNSENNSKITPKNFLESITIWRNRLKLDTKFQYIFYFFIILHWSLLNFYFDQNVSLNSLFIIFIFAFTSYFFVYLQKKIPKSFQSQIWESKDILGTEEDFKRYINYVKKIFRSNKEKYIPPFLAFAFVTGWFIAYYQLFADPIRMGEHILIFLPWHSVWIIIAASNLILIFNTYKCINKLGSEEFPLNITYEELKIGAVNSIGSFIISLTIPLIILSTIFSTIGLVSLFFLNDLIWGYSFISVSLAITSIFSFLLYKNTIHIHESIVKFKDLLKHELINQIQTLKESHDLNIHQKYETIDNIHKFFEKVDDINDWPFNPISVKKFIVTFSSSILPLIISFFGLG